MKGMHPSMLIIVFSLLLVGSSTGFASRPGIKIDGGRLSLTARSLQSPAVNLWKRKSSRRSQCRYAIPALRGGALPSISTALTAKLCVGFFLLSGLTLILDPGRVMGDLYRIKYSKDECFSTFLLRAIGAIEIGVALNLFLSILRKMPAQQAMGFALLPRLLFVSQSFVFGAFEKCGIQKKFLTINTAVMTWSTFSLLTGKGNPLMASKVFSCMALLKGSLLIFSPITAAKKYFGVNVGTDGKFA